MRIADRMNFDQVSQNLSKNRSEMADLQNQAASQKKVVKPSDDPLAATRVLQTRTEISGGQQYLKSIAQAKAFLEYSEQSLGDMTEILNRAKELALSQSNDPSSSHNSRLATATEIDQLFSQAVQVANRKLADRFLFAGFRTTQAPFDHEGNYQGDSGEIQIAIQKEGKIAMNVPGDVAFLGQRLKPEENPQENRQSGSRDSGRDSDSQTSPLASSDGHPVRGPAQGGETARGPASLPGTGPSLPDGVKSSPPGRPEGISVFQVLRDLSTGLKSGDRETIQESLDRIDHAAEQVVLERAKLGSRAATLNSATESLQKVQVDTKALKSSLEDADTFELVSDLNKTESTLKASLQTSGKLIQPSLLDFLR